MGLPLLVKAGIMKGAMDTQNEYDRDQAFKGNEQQAQLERQKLENSGLTQQNQQNAVRTNEMLAQQKSNEAVRADFAGPNGTYLTASKAALATGDWQTAKALREQYAALSGEAHQKLFKGGLSGEDTQSLADNYNASEPNKDLHIQSIDRLKYTDDNGEPDEKWTVHLKNGRSSDQFSLNNAAKGSGALAASKYAATATGDIYSESTGRTKIDATNPKNIHNFKVGDNEVGYNPRTQQFIVPPGVKGGVNAKRFSQILEAANATKGAFDTLKPEEITIRSNALGYANELDRGNATYLDGSTLNPADAWNYGYQKAQGKIDNDGFEVASGKRTGKRLFVPGQANLDSVPSQGDGSFMAPDPANPDKQIRVRPSRDASGNVVPGKFETWVDKAAPPTTGDMQNMPQGTGTPPAVAPATPAAPGAAPGAPATKPAPAPGEPPNAQQYPQRSQSERDEETARRTKVLQRQAAIDGDAELTAIQAQVKAALRAGKPALANDLTNKYNALKDKKYPAPKMANGGLVRRYADGGSVDSPPVAALDVIPLQPRDEIEQPLMPPGQNFREGTNPTLASIDEIPLQPPSTRAAGQMQTPTTLIPRNRTPDGERIVDEMDEKMSFKQAFREARNSDLGKFHWRGKWYTTQMLRTPDSLQRPRR